METNARHVEFQRSGSKAALVRAAVGRMTGAFALADVQAECPGNRHRPDEAINRPRGKDLTCAPS